MYELNFVKSEIKGIDKFNSYENEYYMIREKIYNYEDKDNSYRIINVYSKDTNNYLPEIYVKEDIRTDELKGFEIETTSWGTLGIEELEKKVKGYQIAIETVKELNSMFLKRD